MTTNYTKKRGFTLIETMMAITLLALVVAGPVAVASRSLRAATVSKNQTIAYYLAQDAVEYVRFIKDSNKLSGNTWLAGLDGTSNTHTTGGGNCVSADGSRMCLLNTLLDTVTDCSDVSCVDRMFFHQGTGQYDYEADSGVYSFNRQVSVMTPIGSNLNEALVTVRLNWVDIADTAQSIVIRETIYDWQ